MKKIRFLIILWIVKIIAFTIKIIDKNRGTYISGKIALKCCKDFIKNFTNIDYEKVIIVTGTNGKSTTVNMITHAIKESGRKIATNIEGANMLSGVATTLIKNSTVIGKFNKEILLLEIDERSLPLVYKVIPAKNLCITNLQKDQVQRNGDPDYIYQKIKSIITRDITLYLNNNEPRVKSYEDLVDNVVYYGIEKNEKTFEKNDFYDVTLPCPKCNSKIKFNYYNIDNVGDFECTNCNFKSEKDIKYIAKNINYTNETFECQNVEYSIKYTQPFFLYNYVLCMAICQKFGIEEEKIKQSFTNFKNIFGRLENLKFKTKYIKYIRIKQENPETLQSAIDFVSLDDKPKIVIFGLEQIVDFHPHYTNTFYAFDCNVNRLIQSNVERYICFSEIVADDTANRLIYAGIDKEKISILSTDDSLKILEELDKYDLDNVYLITWLHKYEELSKILNKEEEV